MEEHIFYGLIKNERVQELLVLCSLDFYEFNKKLDHFFDSLKLRKNYAPDDIFSVDSSLLDQTASAKNINSVHEKDLLWYLIVKKTS